MPYVVKEAVKLPGLTKAFREYLLNWLKVVGNIANEDTRFQTFLST